jgi:hypothetical protein
MTKKIENQSPWHDPERGHVAFPLPTSRQISDALSPLAEAGLSIKLDQSSSLAGPYHLYLVRVRPHSPPNGKV